MKAIRADILEDGVYFTDNNHALWLKAGDSAYKVTSDIRLPAKVIFVTSVILGHIEPFLTAELLKRTR